jgi:CheY-like chemotaxis protein
MTDGRMDGRLPARPAGGQLAGPAPDSRAHGVRILHVDDDELNRALVRAALARSAEPLLHTARLIEAADLACARVLLAEGPVDVVLLDLRLPDGSGLALAAELKQAGAAEPPIVVALSGAIESEQRGAALAAGCTAVLSKPYSVASLCDLLIAHLRRRAAAQPGSSAEDQSAITSSSQCATRSK